MSITSYTRLLAPHVAPTVMPCTALASLAHRYIYDSVLEGQMTMLFDANKRLLKVSDVYPKHVRLAKGTHVLHARLRHDDAALLERMKALPLVRKPFPYPRPRSCRCATRM